MAFRAALASIALLPVAVGAQAVQMSAKPTLIIGSEISGPNYQFNEIAHLRRLSDGRIAVAMGPDIRFFDRAGSFAGKAGGRGRGPGEFTRVSELFVEPGDTLVVMNVRDRVVLGPTGKFVRQTSIDMAPFRDSIWANEEVNLLPNGNLFIWQYRRNEANAPSADVHRPTMRYTVLDPSARRATPLVTGGGIAQWVVNGKAGIQPFSPHLQFAIGTDRIYVGDNDSTIIHAFTLTGQPVTTFIVADRVTPVTDADLAEYDSLWNERVTAAQRARFSSGVTGPRRARHPYWGKALVDKLGVLWVSGPPRNDTAPIDWTAYDKTGKRVGRVRMPARFSPHEIGPDYVLGVQRDDTGVETVHMYALRRR